MCKSLLIQEIQLTFTSRLPVHNIKHGVQIPSILHRPLAQLFHNSGFS